MEQCSQRAVQNCSFGAWSWLFVFPEPSNLTKNCSIEWNPGPKSTVNLQFKMEPKPSSMLSPLQKRWKHNETLIFSSTPFPNFIKKDFWHWCLAAAVAVVAVSLKKTPSHLAPSNFELDPNWSHGSDDHIDYAPVPVVCIGCMTPWVLDLWWCMMYYFYIKRASFLLYVPSEIESIFS